MIALPIDPYLPRIVAAARETGVVLVAEPGAGKTTRVPRALLDAGLEGEILVVEPRRIAARMAAARVAEELGEAVGERVGYSVRFETRRSARTRVHFVTEGIALRRIDADPDLAGVGAIVFDELHERHLDTDLALARARLARRRRDLAIVAMSATLDASFVADFLDAPVVSAEGRAFAVEVRHAEAPDERPLERQVRAAVVRVLEASPDGDVLVFLPGAAEIRRAREQLEGPASAFGVDVLPLHGDLPAPEQDRAVRPGPRRKVILSTNVAETSLTIDGVVAVVDSGLARVATVSPWTGLSSLETAPISRASATQRAGRAGRTRPGTCERLYTKRDHDARPERDRPEVLRADLSSTVLSLRAHGIDPRAFEWLERPAEAAIVAAEALLARLGALDAGRPTALGEAMVALPLHPRLARVALEAHRRGHTDSGALLTALLGERDVRRSTRARFDEASADDGEVGSSDLIARLDQLEALGPRESLRDRSLDRRTVTTVWSAAKQIRGALDRVTLPVEPSFDEEEALRRATLAGFPDRLARRRAPRSRELLVAGGGSAELDPASVVREAELMVAVDAVRTSRGVLVRRASAVTLDDLMDHDLDAIEDALEVRFDAATQRVRAERVLRWDGLPIERGVAEPDDAEAARVLAKAALGVGIERFLDGDALETLRRRLRFARTYDPSLPDLDDAWLEALLVRLCEGRRSFAELKDAGLMAWIQSEIEPVRGRLDALAPEHVSIPGRSQVPVRYEVERPPWIESRLQDFFGAAEGPTIANGQHRLLLHLLAPNGRAAQITADLSGFWAGSYAEVKKALRGRYPKHDWPDDPRTASPRRRR
ncbi:MAG: ATP-dependent helicase HrpB [Sandaracinaceae bacterium]|nr:ATP-dependent helicase HrpB [Sandaracinaceae bacterium]